MTGKIWEGVIPYSADGIKITALANLKCAERLLQDAADSFCVVRDEDTAERIGKIADQVSEILK